MTVSSTYPSAITAASVQAGSTAATATSANALTSLAGNFNDFLKLLTTQLQNQDPTAPMDTNQFTTQLVQFAGVGQQINTNATLGQILSANLVQQLGQASSLVGRQVAFSGGTLPLQAGSAQVNFQSTIAQPVQLIITDQQGNPIKSVTVNADAGANTWKWNGTNSNGTSLADGAYGVSASAGGNALPLQAVGTVTGAEQSNQAVQLQFGRASVPFNNVVSIN